MNCRDFIIEFEERRELSGAARLHADDCPGCRKTAVVQTRIWETITAFPTVDAPPTFDFRVKARIADGKPSDFQPKFLPVLRYVLPLAAIVLVFGLLISNTSLFFGSKHETSIAEAIAPTSPTSQVAPESEITPEPAIVAKDVSPAPPIEKFVVNNANQTAKTVGDQRDTAFAVFKPAKKAAVTPRREIAEDVSEGGGSNDKTVTSPRVLMPKGINTNKSTEISPNSSAVSSAAASEDIWAFVGIEIVSENGSRTIKAVKPNSAAARANLKVGDVITAVNGAKLSAAPVNQQKIEIKSLTVTRGAENLEITFVGNK